MSETKTMATSARRIVLPLLIVLVLVIGTVLYSGSALIRIEDVTANRILAGTYGTPDWRVQEMNPLLAQLLVLLYTILPMVNWYGGLLLALLVCSAATAISLAARKRGSMWPGVIIISPIVVLLANSMISLAICALAAATGALVLMDGLSRKRDGLASIIWGAVLFVFGVMLNTTLAIIVGLGACLCWLPCALRDNRMRGLLIGLPLMAVLVGALFGYSSLMYNSPELSAYRSNYSLYEHLQHSNLKGEADSLLAEYGTETYTGDHVDGAADAPAAVEVPENVFDSVGWTLNDASLFFTRYSSDSKLTDPEVLRQLNAEASCWDFTPSRLFSELLNTIKKPQFLLLIGLYILSALGVVLTSRRRGFALLLSALIAFGGHVLMLAHYYNSFADIAPFYLLAITVMLFFFDGESAKAWIARIIAAPTLRIVLAVVVMVGFVGVMGGLLYYTHITPANPGEATVSAVHFLKAYIGENDELLLIGENPNERFKPSTLDVPVRGEDKLLLAGSYDLYSPRRASLMDQFGITNPLPDSIGREDIAYVLMGFPEPVAIRLASEYDIYAADPTVLYTREDLAEQVLQMQALTPEEIAQIQADAAEWAEALQKLEEMAAMSSGDEHDHDHDHAEDADEHDHEAEEDHDHEHEDEATPTPSATATQGNG